MTYCLRIADIPTNERPRERLMTHGPKVLATAELIAILLGTGQGPGIGPAKATSILAAVELGKRTFQFRPLDKTPIDSPVAAVAALSQDLMWQNQERFAVLLLDVKNRLLGTQVITIGTATETLASPREIFREIIRQGATRTIVAHNHPSGNVEPSPEDIELTRQLLAGAQLLGIPLLDHLILGNGNHQSLREITTLWNDYPQGD